MTSHIYQEGIYFPVMRRCEVTNNKIGFYCLGYRVISTLAARPYVNYAEYHILISYSIENEIIVVAAIYYAQQFVVGGITQEVMDEKSSRRRRFVMKRLVGFRPADFSRGITSYDPLFNIPGSNIPHYRFRSAVSSFPTNRTRTRAMVAISAILTHYTIAGRLWPGLGAGYINSR